MLQSVLNHIKASIKEANPNTFQEAFAGARQLQDGKPVIYENNEGKYVGLSDTYGNYFYIRYRDEIDIDIASEGRSTSCDELQGTAPLRIVAWVRNADLIKLSEVLLHDIMAVDFNTMSADDRAVFSDLLISFNAIQYDAEQVYKDETLEDNNDNVTLEKGTVIMAIDFGVSFHYKLKASNCIDRVVCTGCTT